MLLHYAKDPLAITHMAIRKCNCLRYTCRKSSSEWIWMGIFHYLRIHTLPKSSPNMMRNSRLSRHQVHRFSWDLKGGSIFWKQLDCNPTVKVRHKHEIDQIWSNSLGVFFYILLPSLQHSWWLSAHTVGPPGSFAQHNRVPKFSEGMCQDGQVIRKWEDLGSKQWPKWPKSVVARAASTCNLDHHVTFWVSESNPGSLVADGQTPENRRGIDYSRHPS